MIKQIWQRLIPRLEVGAGALCAVSGLAAPLPSSGNTVDNVGGKGSLASKKGNATGAFRLTPITNFITARARAGGTTSPP